MKSSVDFNELFDHIVKDCDAYLVKFVLVGLYEDFNCVFKALNFFHFSVDYVLLFDAANVRIVRPSYLLEETFFVHIESLRSELLKLLE